MPCIRVCKESLKCPSEKGPKILSEALRKVWQEWDLRILLLYILFTQIYLHVFGRRRRRSPPGMLNRLNLWLLYLFAELLATIALGKLSNLESPISLLRGLWPPIILFYLGGPDTLTVLHLEENHMWTRHLIGLFTQGVRTIYALIVTWSASYMLSVLALLMLFSGLIKYGERVWVIHSRVRGKSDGLVWFDESTASQNKNLPDNANLVVKAYSYFQILKPHLPFRDCDTDSLEKLLKGFREWVGIRSPESAKNAFKLIEIELGFTYDVLFSKVDTIFTRWGCILRFFSFSCVVSVLVGFILVEKPDEHLRGDVPITIILLCGAIYLEIAGVFVQLVSDWAVVWACNYHSSKLVTPIFHLHKLAASKTRRWSEKISQFNLLNICINRYEPTKFEELEEALCGREKMMKFSSLTPIPSRLQELIIGQLLEPSLPDTSLSSEVDTLQNSLEVDTLQNSTNLRKGVWTLEKYGFELEFQESIVVWHIATDICYHLEDPKMVKDELVEASKLLSRYMMHLLVICRYRIPICNASDKYMKACDHVKKVLRKSFKSPIEACRLLRETECDSSNVTVNITQKLVRDLMADNVENKWKIIKTAWVEMLCYAASCCPATKHIEGLRYGGEFLTHVWLLLMHFGVTKKLEENASQNLQEPAKEGLKNTSEFLAGLNDRYLLE